MKRTVLKMTISLAKPTAWAIVFLIYAGWLLYRADVHSTALKKNTTAAFEPNLRASIKLCLYTAITMVLLAIGAGAINVHNSAKIHKSIGAASVGYDDGWNSACTSIFSRPQLFWQGTSYNKTWCDDLEYQVTNSDVFVQNPKHYGFDPSSAYDVTDSYQVAFHAGAEDAWLKVFQSTPELCFGTSCRNYTEDDSWSLNASTGIHSRQYGVIGF
jgi:hypothetical protein